MILLKVGKGGPKQVEFKLQQNNKTTINYSHFKMIAPYMHNSNNIDIFFPKVIPVNLLLQINSKHKLNK